MKERVKVSQVTILSLKIVLANKGNVDKFLQTTKKKNMKNYQACKEKMGSLRGSSWKTYIFPENTTSTILWVYEHWKLWQGCVDVQAYQSPYFFFLLLITYAIIHG